LLDADQVPTRDPKTAFEWAEYAESGAVFWPDIVDLSCDNPIWAFCDVCADQRVSFETGQLLVDKAQHWQALHAALYLNEHADVFYRLVYGDKDTFLAAWLFTHAGHVVVPHRPLIDERCLFQRDFSGEVIFQHRVGAKWTYSGQQQDVPGFVHFDACLEALGELRSKWSGRVFHPPARSLRARQTEVTLAQQGAFIMRLPGESDKSIRLLPHGEVGEGRSLDIQHWFVRQTGRAMEIVLHDGFRETHHFQPTDRGRWSGSTAFMPCGEAHLLPREACSETAERSDFGMSLAADIVRAELSVSPFDGKMAQRLETIFTVIARAEPQLIADVRNLSRRIGENTPMGSYLRALAARLVATNEEAKPFQRSESSMLHDPSHYVWP
jgi:putative mannosyltransferase